MMIVLGSDGAGKHAREAEGSKRKRKPSSANAAGFDAHYNVVDDSPPRDDLAT